MPIHDWTRVDARIFHDFHHAWIEEIKRALNADLLPTGYYALAEQHAAGFGPDVLTLEASRGGNGDGPGGEPPPGLEGGVALLSAPPKARVVAESDLEFYRRKQSMVAVRHVSGDELVPIHSVSQRNVAGARR